MTNVRTNWARLIILAIVSLMLGLVIHALAPDSPYQVGAIVNFIPQIWSGRLLVALRKNHVYASVANRDYEGEIRAAGDTVKIRSLGGVTIFDVTKNADIPAPEVLSDSVRTIVVDQAKGFNFAVDDIDAAQSDTQLIDPAMEDAGYRLRDAADSFLAGKYVDAGTVVGTDAAPIVPTSDTAYTHLVDLGVQMDEDDIPQDGRWVILPAWYIGLLSKNAQFIAANPEQMRNGFAGTVAGFRTLMSNNIPKVVNGTAQTVYQVMAGRTEGLAFVEQISKVEAFRPERRFSDAVKGLYVYGGKLIRPEMIANFKVARA